MGLVHNPNIVSDGLVGCWDAANKRSYPPGAGTTWTDLAGSNSATLINGTTFADVSLGVIALDGTNDSVKVPIIDGPNGFSFSIWLYFLTIPADDYTAFSIYNGSGAEFMFYVLEASRYTVSYMLGIRGAGTGNTLTSTNTAYGPGFNVGKWVHYCATYNGGGTTTVGNYKVYFNGQGTDINLVENFAGSGNQDPMKWGEDVGAGDLNGYMGHITFYNRALTATEALQNYEATKSRFLPRITKSGLLGYWDAGDPASYPGGTTLKNTVSGTAATFVNMDGSNFNSANGGYWDFDGTNEAISTNSKFNARTLGFTGTAWVKMTGDKVDNVFFWQNYVAQFRYDNSDKLNFSEGLGNNWGGAVDITSAADLIANDTWVHVAAVYDSSDDGRKLYLNGAVVASNTSVITGSQAAPIRTMYFGSEETVSAYLLDGSIAQVILYEGALSDAEILDNYNATKGRFT